MVNEPRVWDKLRALADDFSRRDFQFLNAFADELRIKSSSSHPGSAISGHVLDMECVHSLLSDTTQNSFLRTAARQYGVDNPVEIVHQALGMISGSGAHYSDSLKTTVGKPTMKINESAMRRVVHRYIFSEDNDPHVSQPTGMYSFAVKIQYTTPESDAPRTQVLTIRANGPETAKSMAARTAREMNYSAVSILDVELVKYSGPGQPGLVPVTGPTNVQPGAVDGLVSPSNVSPGLSNAGVDTPNSGSGGTGSMVPNSGVPSRGGYVGGTIPG
jgi:hypothetical protein